MQELIVWMRWEFLPGYSSITSNHFHDSPLPAIVLSLSAISCNEERCGDNGSEAPLSAHWLCCQLCIPHRQRPRAGGREMALSNLLPPRFTGEKLILEQVIRVVSSLRPFHSWGCTSWVPFVPLLLLCLPHARFGLGQQRCGAAQTLVRGGDRETALLRLFEQ